jgi:hypothetical protein
VTVANLLAELTTLGVALGAALGATFEVELRHRADCCPIDVLTDRRPRLRFPLLVGGFRSVPERLGSPEHPSKPARHPYLAAPSLLLTVRHFTVLSFSMILTRSDSSHLKSSVGSSFEAAAMVLAKPTR